MIPHMRASRSPPRMIATATEKFLNRLRAECRSGARAYRGGRGGGTTIPPAAADLLCASDVFCAGVASGFWQRPSGRTHRPRVTRRIGAIWLHSRSPSSSTRRHGHGEFRRFSARSPPQHLLLDHRPLARHSTVAAGVLQDLLPGSMPTNDRVERGPPRSPFVVQGTRPPSIAGTPDR